MNPDDYFSGTPRPGIYSDWFSASRWIGEPYTDEVKDWMGSWGSAFKAPKTDLKPFVNRMLDAEINPFDLEEIE